MSTKIFVNLPVKDLKRSMAFFATLGYEFNQQFTDDNAACMIISDDIYAMLLVESFFKTFTKKAIVDARSSTEVAIALTRDSRQDVDRIVKAAVAAGGSACGEPKDHGFMYQWGFEDPDGHTWDQFWMNPTHVQG